MNQKLKQQIMGRIYAAYFLREYGYSVLNSFVFIAASFALYASVSWKHVFANMPSPADLSGLYNFSTTAIFHTEHAVQLSLAAFTATLIWYATKLTKTVSNSHKPIRQII